MIHQIRNHLAVAMANIEAFQDGVLGPTPKRLGAVLQALGEVEVLLREFPPIDREPSPEVRSEPPIELRDSPKPVKTVRKREL